MSDQIRAGLIDLAAQVTGVLPLVHGGTGAALIDPNADRILFWDDSAGAFAFLAPGNSIAISGTTLDTVQDIRTTARPVFDALITADTDTSDFTSIDGLAAKLVARSASSDAWAFAVVNASLDAAHYAIVSNIEDVTGVGQIYGGLDGTVALLFYPTDWNFSDPTLAGTLAITNDLVRYPFFGGATASLGRAVNPWFNVFTLGLSTDNIDTHTLLIQAYDVNGAAYKTFGTLTNGNTPSFDLSSPAGGSLTGDFTTLAVGGVSAVTTSGTQTLTNKRITKRVVTAADATSVTPNSDNADITYQANTQATGTLTINADGGTPTNGQSWAFKIKSTNVQTFSWNAIFVGGTTALPTASTGSSKIDYFTFIYDAVTPKWDYTGSAVGF